MLPVSATMPDVMFDIIAKESRIEKHMLHTASYRDHVRVMSVGFLRNFNNKIIVAIPNFLTFTVFKNVIVTVFINLAIRTCMLYDSSMQVLVD